MIRLPLFVLFFCLANIVRGEDKVWYYEINEDVTSSYDQIMALNFEEAQKSLSHIRTSQPNNFSAHHLANYIDFLEMIISEDEQLYNRKLIERSQRIDKLKEADPTSPYQLYVLGEIYLQWALVKFKFQDYYSGFRDASKAYKYFKKNQEKFPHFVLNNKGMGTIETLVGVIPENLRWGLKLLGGLEGDTQSGLQKLDKAFNALNDQSIFKKEVGIIYAYLLLHYGHQKDKSWNIIESLDLKDNNPTHLFIKANLAHYQGKTDLAISLLSAYQKEEKTISFEYLDYMLGVSKLNRLDHDADSFLLKYVNNFKGQYYIKDAYLRLAWHEIVHGNFIGYDNYLEQVRSQGSADISFDKTAMRYASVKRVPNSALLKARLLYDGGYFEEANQLLSVVEKYKLESAADKLEYTYRLGRIKQQLELTKEAIKLFELAVKMGRNEKSHYACNSALQIGMIHEDLGQVSQAMSAYKLCLSIKPSDYRQSLHQQAKSGLRRLQD